MTADRQLQEARETLRGVIADYVADGFRDDDGVWWDGSHQQNATAALDALVARVEQAEREAALQMGAKLEAQTALAAITTALDLELADLGDGWTEGCNVILARIEEIVDEAERGFREREQAEAREAALREGRRDLDVQECAVVLHHREADALLALLEAAINSGMTPGAGLRVEDAREAGFKIVGERFRDQDPYNRAPRNVAVKTVRAALASGGSTAAADASTGGTT